MTVTLWTVWVPISRSRKSHLGTSPSFEAVEVRLRERRERVVRHDQRFAELALAAIVFVGAGPHLREPELLAPEFGEGRAEVAEALEAIVGAGVRRLGAVGVVDDVGDLVNAVRHGNNELRGVLVERRGGEVGVALDGACGEHALPDVFEVGVELEEFRNVDADLDARPYPRHLVHDFRPAGRELGIAFCFQHQISLFFGNIII